MIDSAQILAAQLVDRYLSGQLSAEEAAKFEEHLLEHPEVQSEIDVARRLKLGLATLRRRGELEALVAGKRGASSGPLFALAATVLVTLGIGMFYFTHRGPPMLGASIQAFATDQGARMGAEVMFVRTRDSTAVSIEMPGAGQIVALHFLTDAYAAAATFDVLIAREGAAEPLAQVEDLRADDGATVTVYFDARAAGAGDYRVRLEPQNSGSEELEPEEYLLRVGSAAQP